MSIELYLRRTVNGLSPEDQIGNDELAKIKLGTRVLCKITKLRNPEFHRKFFALLNVGFRFWVPGSISCKYGTPEKNFDQFRSDVIILAGYFDMAIRLDGSTRVTPKSISFGRMEQDDFEKLYSSVIDVLLKNIFVNYTKEDVIDMAAKEILNFT